MLSHNSIWSAIDGLAKTHQLSPSGLAKLAGLDPTSFNPSKRIKPDGRPRWPSTESIAKILDATQTNAAVFFTQSAIVGDGLPTEREEVISFQVEGDQFMPFYPDGAELLLTPVQTPTIGERVMVNCARNGLALGDVEAVRARSISLSLLTEQGISQSFGFSNLQWVARIRWASQ